MSASEYHASAARGSPQAPPPPPPPPSAASAAAVHSLSLACSHAERASAAAASLSRMSAAPSGLGSHAAVVASVWARSAWQGAVISTPFSHAAATPGASACWCGRGLARMNESRDDCCGCTPLETRPTTTVAGAAEGGAVRDACGALGQNCSALQLSPP